ncbi:MAG: hypothetical protein IT460_08510 [Planctomycetes bacterium]|nr:hypothetical protein [Planctomycetota bacterium]
MRLARRLAPVGLAAALAAAGCGSTPRPKEARSTALPSEAPEPFQDVRESVLALARDREAADAAAARGRVPEVTARGRRLLLMAPPVDLKRQDVARFLEGRAAFTQALNAFGAAADSPDDAALWASTRDLEAAYWAWYDAYRGRPSEGAI